MDNPPLPTKEKLARALEALGDPNLAAMIVKARAGYFDDFESELAMPELQLVHDLIAHGHRQFALRVIAGEFDATEAEGQAWWETGGRALFTPSQFEGVTPKAAGTPVKSPWVLEHDHSQAFKGNLENLERTAATFGFVLREKESP